LILLYQAFLLYQLLRWIQNLSHPGVLLHRWLLYFLLYPEHLLYQ
jgi:hypothetical protein